MYELEARTQTSGIVPKEWNLNQIKPRCMQRCLWKKACDLLQGTGAQRDILKCFQKLGMQAEADVLKYGIPIDVVVPEVQIAVEFDGTTKMFDNRPDIPLGKTIFKHNLIRSMGLKLIAIPLQNWTLLKGRLAQLEFLEGKLEELGLKLIKSY